MKPYQKYSEAEQGEVVSALETIKGQKNSISKSAIWTEIDTHPERYPVLAARAPKRVLCIISYVMNERYELFGGSDGRKRVRNAVWELNRQIVLLQNGRIPPVPVPEPQGGRVSMVYIQGVME